MCQVQLNFTLHLIEKKIKNCTHFFGLIQQINFIFKQ